MIRFKFLNGKNSADLAPTRSFKRPFATFLKTLRLSFKDSCECHSPAIAPYLFMMRCLKSTVREISGNRIRTCSPFPMRSLARFK